jgi:hypothetical protein
MHRAASSAACNRPNERRSAQRTRRTRLGGTTTASALADHWLRLDRARRTRLACLCRPQLSHCIARPRSPMRAPELPHSSRRQVPLFEETYKNDFIIGWLSQFIL